MNIAKRSGSDGTGSGRMANLPGSNAIWRPENCRAFSSLRRQANHSAKRMGKLPLRITGGSWSPQ